MLCFDKRWLAPFGIKPEEIAGYIHDAGQPTVHFNVMRERGFSQKKVAIDEASPIYYIGDADEYAPMLFLISTNDMANRYEQTMLLLGTLKHMDYDMSKVEMQVLEGTHSKYKDYTLAGLVSSYIKKLENK